MPLINFSGLASGIDTNSLIDATSAATRQQRVKPSQDKISQLQEANTAISTLKEKLNTLKDKTFKFATLSGGPLSKQATSSNESVLTGTAANSAANGTYTVTVSTLAKNANFSFDDRFSSTSTSINSSINDGAAAATRTVQFTIGTGATQTTASVVMTSTTTVDQFVTSFNAATTKAVASAVNVGTAASPSYAIVINTVESGTEEGSLSVSVGSEITTAGSGAFSSDTLSQATDAAFTVSGITGTISRSSNTVADVLSGVTLDFVSTGTSTVRVSDDSATSTSTVQDFVDAFNDLNTYIRENNTITRDESGSEVTNIFAALASTSLDDNSLSSLREAFSSSSYSSGSTVRILADLGITSERDGSLKFDSTVFQNAIATESSSVTAVLESLGDRVSTTGGTIDQITRFGGTLDIETNSNNDQISDLNRRIADAESFISKQEEAMRQRFATLESTMSRLQQQQQSLTSALAGLG